MIDIIYLFRYDDSKYTNLTQSRFIMICKYCNRERGESPICPRCGARNLVDPQPHHLPVGTAVGNRYIIHGVLGEGGFGITYLGEDSKLGNVVAIKEYFPHGYSYRDTYSGNDVYVSSGSNAEVFIHGRNRFLKEATTLAKFIDEPGIVDATDYIEENNTAYLVMKYLDGITLKDYQKEKGRLDPIEVIEMLYPIIDSLEKIHSAGIIHRDISPDNIMLLKNGKLKLMDFGSARDFVDDKKTMSIMLKQGYAPEEQYRRNGEQGPWTDVYALCATIYRCITGITPIESLERLRNDELKSPYELGVSISPELENVLGYGLAVKKENRCHDMTELKRLFDQALSAHPTPVYEGVLAGNIDRTRSTWGNPNTYYDRQKDAQTYRDLYADKSDRVDYSKSPSNPSVYFKDPSERAAYLDERDRAESDKEDVPDDAPTYADDFSFAQKESKKSKKTYGRVIAAIVTIVLMVSLITGAFLLYPYYKPKDTDDQTGEGTSASAAGSENKGIAKFTADGDSTAAKAFNNTLTFAFDKLDLSNYHLGEGYTDGKYAITENGTNYDTVFENNDTKSFELGTTITLEGNEYILDQTKLKDMIADGWKYEKDKKPGANTTKPQHVNLTYNDKFCTVYIDKAGDDPEETAVYSFFPRGTASKHSDPAAFSYRGITGADTIDSVIQKMGQPSQYTIEADDHSDAGTITMTYFADNDMQMWIEFKINSVNGTDILSHLYFGKEK